jgi:DNA-directed RNA polymerase III subunit RPC6
MAESESVKVDVLKDALYEACSEHGDDRRLFTQADLLGLNILPTHDVGLLMRLVQALTNERLFVAVTDVRVGLAWRFRRREDAEKCVPAKALTISRSIPGHISKGGLS